MLAGPEPECRGGCGSSSVMTARTLASTLVAMMVAGGAACRRGGSTGMPTVDWLSVPPQAGPIGVADNRRYLVDHAGRPFFLHGEAAWSLISATKREDVELYLSDRRARGFNAISVVLIDHLEPPTNCSVRRERSRLRQLPGMEVRFQLAGGAGEQRCAQHESRAFALRGSELVHAAAGHREPGLATMM